MSIERRIKAVETKLASGNAGFCPHCGRSDNSAVEAVRVVLQEPDYLNYLRHLAVLEDQGRSECDTTNA